MIEKDTVTCFLEHKGKILILKRSSKVGNYNGKWAGVSGYIEKGESPLETAKREISEELEVGSKHIELIKQGELMLVPDKGLGIVWRTRPFLFKCKTDKIKTDWEHDEYRWIDPIEITNYDTVPMLKEALEKVMHDGTI